MSLLGDNLYTLRPGQADDYAFIKATWLRGMYYGDSWFSQIPKPIFMDVNSKFFDKLLLSSSTKVTVACLSEDPGVILGYAITSLSGEIAHFVYVKASWRKQGIARHLLSTFPKSVSHLTKLGAALLNKIGNPIFNPYINV